MTFNYEVRTDHEYGVVLTIFDSEIADEADDYFSENFYLFYDARESESKVEFFFGEVASEEAVRNLLISFSKTRK